MGQELGKSVPRHFEASQAVAKSLLASGMPNDPKTRAIWQLLQMAKNIPDIAFADKMFALMKSSGSLLTNEGISRLYTAYLKNENLAYFYRLMFLQGYLPDSAAVFQVGLWELSFSQGGLDADIQIEILS
jgi:hypothetical protein